MRLVPLAIFGLVLVSLGAAVGLGFAALGGQIGLGQTPAAFWAAFVAATAAVASLAVGKLVEIWIDHDRRSRERREMVVAIHAEIRSNVARQREAFAKPNRASVFEKIARKQQALSQVEQILRDTGLKFQAGELQAAGQAKAGDRTETPSSISDRQNLVLESLRDAIFQLPPGVIGPIVVYYNLDAMLNRLIDETSASAFKAREADRQREHWVDVFTLTNKVDEAADLALGRLQSALGWRGAPSEATLPRWSPFEAAEVAAEVSAPPPPAAGGP